MEVVIDTIVKYWVGILCGGVLSVLALFGKKIKKRVVEVRDDHKAKEDERYKKTIIEAITPLAKEIVANSDRKDAEMQKNIELLTEQITTIDAQVDLMTEGVLSVQGSNFKKQCRELIRQEEPITEDQYEICMHDHTTYNRLGGNHEGDQLFKLVTIKYEGQLAGK